MVVDSTLGADVEPTPHATKDGVAERSAAAKWVMDHHSWEAVGNRLIEVYAGLGRLINHLESGCDE
jgi:hypothetical protein